MSIPTVVLLDAQVAEQDRTIGVASRAHLAQMIAPAELTRRGGA